MNISLTIGSLFSGIGGLELGLEWAGLGPVIWQAENNSYCRKVLEKHWPNVKRFKDVKEVTNRAKRPGLICGGFPCQDISAAGKGAGLIGSRSGLWFEFYRIVHEIEPEWIVVENVGSAATRWVDPVRRALELIGYETFPVPLSAQDVGAPHLRRRVFIAAQAVDTWSKRKWRSGGGCNVADSHQKRRIRGARTEQTPARWGQPEDGDSEMADTEKQYRTEHGPETPKSGRSGQALADSDSKQEIGPAKPWEERDPWAIEPDVGRVAYGVPARAHRLRALGNAVVPQCAEVIGHIVLELIRRQQKQEENNK